ncbi:MBL fold metallo-hydrolase, partial [bacterium]|nr:MBL fold metallo-hydrolase [bacterium]
MKPREIKPGIFSVGAIDWDRRLFDELIPLPDGTSYNSYLIVGGDKVALIDTVDPPLGHMLEENLKAAGKPDIDYVVCLHAEQDHSGSIPRVLELHPNARVVTNPKCKGMLIDLLHIPEKRFIEVEDRETLSLGGRTFEFVYTPWVHWPETMTAYLREEKLLFSCDFFGSHLATSDAFVTDRATVYEAAKRYYAEIMMPFRKFIRKHLSTLAKLEINVIAPSHGPAYDEPSF